MSNAWLLLMDMCTTHDHMMLGSADKFYELKQTDDHTVTIRYGRRLSGGVTSNKCFDTAAEVRPLRD
jgi:predicted DNA-binding WGR domain protein